jgi:hypothetical protein
MSVRLAVGAILRTGLRICFLATFCDTFLRFCKLGFLLLVRSSSLTSRSLARGVSFRLRRSHLLINLALSSLVGR